MKLSAPKTVIWLIALVLARAGDPEQVCWDSFHRRIYPVE